MIFSSPYCQLPPLFTCPKSERLSTVDRCLQTSKPVSKALGIPIYVEHGNNHLLHYLTLTPNPYLLSGWHQGDEVLLYILLPRARTQRQTWNQFNSLRSTLDIASHPQVDRTVRPRSHGSAGHATLLRKGRSRQLRRVSCTDSQYHLWTASDWSSSWYIGGIRGVTEIDAEMGQIRTEQCLCQYRRLEC